MAVKWLTRKYIAQQARKSNWDAWVCSLLHWQQILDATPRELKIAFNRHRVRFDSDYCALCQRVCSTGIKKCCLQAECDAEVCTNGYGEASSAAYSKMEDVEFNDAPIRDFIKEIQAAEPKKKKER
jgi:hypothetical protein